MAAGGVEVRTEWTAKDLQDWKRIDGCSVDAEKRAQAGEGLKEPEWRREE